VLNRNTVINVTKMTDIAIIIILKYFFGILYHPLLIIARDSSQRF